MQLLRHAVIAWELDCDPLLNQAWLSHPRCICCCRLTLSVRAFRSAPGLVAFQGSNRNLNFQASWFRGIYKLRPSLDRLVPLERSHLSSSSLRNRSLLMMGDHDQQWGKYSDDYHSGAWLKDAVEGPFLESHFKSFALKAVDRGKPWKALDIGCGMGRYTIRLLQAGASYVLSSDAAVNMVSGAKKETEQYLIGLGSGPGTPKADFHVCSAAHLTSIPGIEEGTFDLAISIYVLCNLPSKEDVKQALVEVSKLLRPGGTFLFYEPHIVEYMTMTHSTGHVEYLPKEDGTEYKYFEDEGKPRTLRIRMNSGNPIVITNRFYTLSFWVTSLLEAGFQISQFHEPHSNPKDLPSDAPSYMRYYAEWPSAMVWVCTKVAVPLQDRGNDL